MTEGSGGGTITTTAIYNNMPQVIMETLNVQFIKASNLLNPINEIHALTDITNGGINGDANEINKTTGLGIHLYEEKIIELINPKVYEMLKTLNIDPLGVSIDSLMIITPKNTADKIIKTLAKENIKSGIIGYVNNTGKTTIQKSTGEIQELVPKFREAAYTPVKKVVDEIKTINFEEGKQEIDKVTREVISKKEDIVRWIQNKHE